MLSGHPNFQLDFVHDRPPIEVNAARKWMMVQDVHRMSVGRRSIRRTRNTCLSPQIIIACVEQAQGLANGVERDCRAAKHPDDLATVVHSQVSLEEE